MSFLADDSTIPCGDSSCDARRRPATIAMAPARPKTDLIFLTKRAALYFDLTPAGGPLIDRLYRTLWLMENRRGELPKFLPLEAKPNREPNATGGPRPRPARTGKAAKWPTYPRPPNSRLWPS